MSESWLLWRDGTHDPFFNMSMDEVLLEEAPSLGAPLIRTYRWDRPSLSIGSSQLYPESEEARYAIVRRPTGGGNVYHDVDLTYTAVIPAGHSLTDLNRMDSYRIFHEAMLPMLAALGVAAELKSDETPDVDEQIRHRGRGRQQIRRSRAAPDPERHPASGQHPALRRRRRLGEAECGAPRRAAGLFRSDVPRNADPAGVDRTGRNARPLEV